jgi:cytochrome c biogenesis protein CcmG/thiol:disulfide interchange protein DsbE
MKDDDEVDGGVTAVQTEVADDLLGSEPGSGGDWAPRHRTTLWRRVRVALVAVAAAFLVFGAAGSVARKTDRSAPAMAGGPAAAFAVENIDPDEGPVSLSAYRGTPVVLNFWASWCSPCRRELRAFEAVSEQTKGEVAFIGLDTRDDSRAAAARLLATTGARYPSGYDPAGQVASTYGLYGLPTTVFISSDGQLLARLTGEMSRAKLEATIARLFQGDRVATYYTGSQ